LAPIGDKSVNVGSPLTFRASATDPDLPAQTLSFALDANAPAGATINPSTGVFSWTPPPGQASTVYNVTVIVCDDGTPSMCAQQTFSITVGGVANLVVSSKGTPNPAVVNCNYSYTVTVSNQGPETAFSVMLTNYLPASASFVSSHPGGSFSPEWGGWVFYLGDLPPGWTTNVTIVALPTVLGTMTNVATAGSSTPEVDVSDNTSTLVPTVEQGVHLEITSPTNGSVLLAPLNIPITTTSADPNSIIRKVEFYVGDLKIGECFTTPYGTTWTNPPAGHYLLTARALDKDGTALCATTVTIDVVPGISISDGFVTEANNTTTEVLFPVRLSVSSTQTVSVDFETSDGTALAGWDYVPMRGTVIFPPGVTNRTISIPVIGDTLSETNEAFFVHLSNPTNGLILADQGMGTIRDNNDPFPRLHICDVVIAEGNQGTSTAVFVVQLSTFSGRPVTVNYSTAPGTASNNVDFIPVSGVLTFAPGTLQQSIQVPIVGDLLNENDETFFVNLSKPTNCVIMHAQGLGTIVDDDLIPTLSIGNATVTEGNSGTTNAVFQVLLSAPSGKTINVRYATASGSATMGKDFIPASGVLTFTPGVTSKTISVAVRGDTLSESNEFFFVNLSKPLNSAISHSQGIGTILDDDVLPILSVNDIVVPEAGFARFTVRLSAASGRTVLVQYGTSDGTAQAGLDYRATNGSLVFPPGTTARTIYVPIIPDTLSEDNENFFVYLLNAVNATLVRNRGQATIQDNDPLPVAYVNDSSVKEGNFGNPIIDFNVRLSAPSAKPISISYHVTPGSARENVDYLPASGTLVFLSGMTNLTIPVAVVGDTLSESNETFFVNLSAPVNATIGRGRAQGTILDDDGDVWISINNVSVLEPDTTRTNAQFTVSLSAPSGKTVVVCYNTFNGSALAGKDYLGIAGTLKFPPGVTNLSLLVPVLGDTLSESNETFFVRLYAPVNGKIATPFGRGTILDNNDPVPAISINDINVAESGVGIFTVRLSAVSGQTILVNYSTADGTATAGSDYTPTSGTVVFAPGMMSRTISVPILPDTLSESNETFFVNLGNPVNASLLKPQGKGTIIDNDPLPSLTVNDITGFEGSSAIFAVHLSAQSGKTVTVNYATANGTALAGVHYTSTSGTLTFAPGTRDLPLSVTLLNDGIAGTSNRFALNLSGAANAGIADGQGICTILENRAAAPKSASAKSEKDLKITWVKVLGTNVIVSFPTLLGRNHLLEYNEQSVSASNAWQPVEGAANLLGTGNSITAIHIGGASRTNCFYRVRVQP
ncbi:MAG: retention module-containing protein, partial [Verrucomicrobiales bacterium]|nr:retention module-containing protein [Verrucomicrobiales bacterium]